MSRACASANQAITDAADQIALGHADIVIAGGAESLSNVPILHSRGFSDALIAASRAKTLAQRGRRLLAGSGRSDLRPRRAGDRRAVDGRDHGAVGREDGEDQPHPARRTGSVRAAVAPAGGGGHDRRAARPPRSRRLYVPRRGTTRSSRATTASGTQTSYDQLAALKPVFDRAYGTVTAGNSSPLTDGGAAVLLMSEERARALGYAPLAFIRSYAYAALDPGEQLLQAPVLAAPVALQRAGLTLKDIDLIEMHEAFAAQVLSNLRGLRVAAVGGARRLRHAGRRGGSTRSST